MIDRICQFSPDRKYRYTLWREWTLTDLFPDVISGTLMVIGLNPSIADETQDDPTIRRCVSFAKAWGYAALCMTNVFAWRDTDPGEMKMQQEPCGPDNDIWLRRCADEASMILAAWGTHGTHHGGANAVEDLLSDKTIYCLGRTKDGHPKHPLYIASKTKPEIYKEAR